MHTTRPNPPRLFTAALFLLTASAAHAALNDSGQTLCYDSSSNVAICDNNFSGDAGFDFTKISNSGNELSSTATPGTGPNDWGCTKDNVTGLMWEVKLADGSPRDRNATYTKDSTGGSCSVLGTCDTDTYITHINSSPGLCGQTNWRLPNLRELASIVHYGQSAAPLIDTNAFPNTVSGEYWSSEAVPAASNSWYVRFAAGNPISTTPPTPPPWRYAS